MKTEKDIQMARLIAEQVREAGGSTYYVGGYVRDVVLGRESKDIDLEIHGIPPQVLEEILKDLGEPTVMGSSFGIFGLRHYGLDIAMPRRTGPDSRGGKHFQECVDPFAGTENAARRRDLTMNALMQDVLTGEIIDPFGGCEDLKKGIIRHVDDETFAEDPLRVLRVAQFASRFRFSVAEETVALAASLDLSGIAKERIWGEVEKVLLKAEQPSLFFETLRKMGQLDIWFPEVRDLIGVEQEKRFHPEGDVWNHTMLVLDAAAQLRRQASYPLGFMVSALCHDFGKVTATRVIDGRIRALGHEEDGIPPAKAFLGRMTREGKLKQYVMNMIGLHMRPNIMAAQKSGVKAMCRMFDLAEVPEDLLLLAKADHCSRPGVADYEAAEEFLRQHLAIYRERMAQPHVMGADLIRAGYMPDKDFSEALAHAHRLQLAGVSRESTLKEVLAFLKKSRGL